MRDGGERSGFGVQMTERGCGRDSSLLVVAQNDSGCLMLDVCHSEGVRRPKNLGGGRGGEWPIANG